MSREEFLSIADSYYADFESLKDAPNFYDYEKSFVDLWQKLGQEYTCACAKCKYGKTIK